jgi:hypothetical protein
MNLTRAIRQLHAWSRRPLAPLCVIVAVGMANIGVQFTPVRFPRSDDARYCALAESLATDGTYRMVTHPDRPFEAFLPPGYPAFLAMLAKIGGMNFLLFQAASVVLSLLSLAFWWIALRRALGNWTAFLSLLAVAANAYWGKSASAILSEPLFYCLSGAACCLMAGLIDARSTTSPKFRSTVALGVSLGTLMLVRTQGACFAAGMGVHLLLQRRFRLLAPVVLAAALIWIPWQLHQRSAGTGETGFDLVLLRDPYQPQLGRVEGISELIGRGVENARSYFAIGPIVLGIPLRKLNVVLSLIVWGGIVFGGARLYRRTRTSWVGSILLLLMLLNLAWPFLEGGRFLWPMLPGLYACLWLALFGVVAAVCRGLGYPRALTIANGRLAGGLALVPLLMIFAGHAARRTMQPPARATPEYEQACEWIRAHGEPGPVMCRKPWWTYFAAGHTALVYPLTTDDGEYLEQIRRYSVTYIIQEQADFEGDPSQSTRERYLLPFIERHKHDLEPVYRTDSGETIVWRVRGNTNAPYE